MKKRMYKFNTRHRRFDPATRAFLLLLILSMAVLCLGNRQAQHTDTPPASSELLQSGTDSSVIDTQISEGYFDPVPEHSHARPILLNFEKMNKTSESVNITVIGNLIRSSVCDAWDSCTQLLHSLIFDTEPPVIVLNGDETLTIQVGSEYTDPGFSATDNADGDITASVTVSGSHDPSTPGTYTYTYSVTDAAGNTTSVNRTVIVETPPQSDNAPTGKVIYLTFDDGPGAYTPELLAVLEKYNVKVTFFVVGTAMLEYLDDIAAAGHAIGVHSNTHTYKVIYASEEAFFEDFNAIHNTILSMTGIDTKICRFPGGGSNKVSKKYCKGIMTRLVAALDEKGYTYFDWNVDSKDAGGAKTAEAVYKNVINGIKGKDYAIVLQHDIKKYSVDAVEMIIQWGLANGYTFLPLDETSPTVHHKVNN